MKENGSLGVAMCKFGEELGIKFSHDLDIAGKLMGLQSYGGIDHEFKKKIIDKYTLYDVSKFFYSADDWVKYLNDDLLLKLKPLDWIRTVHEATSEILIKFFEDVTKGLEIAFNWPSDAKESTAGILKCILSSYSHGQLL